MFSFEAGEELFYSLAGLGSEHIKIRFCPWTKLAQREHWYAPSRAWFRQTNLSMATHDVAANMLRSSLESHLVSYLHDAQIVEQIQRPRMLATWRLPMVIENKAAKRLWIEGS